MSNAEEIFQRGIQDFNEGKQASGLANLREAASLQPNNAAYYNFLGQALYFSGEMEEARRCYSRAVKLDQNMAAAWKNLGVLCQDTSDLNTACEAYARAVSLNRSDANTIQLFMQIFSLVHFEVFSDWIKNVLIFCFKYEQASHQVVSRAWANYFMIDPTFKKLRGKEEWETPPEGLDDPLLNLALRRMYVCSMGFERIMTRLRRLFLTKVKKFSGYEDFLASLATQCWLNEHIYARTEEEEKRLSALKAKIEKKTGGDPDYIAQLCLYACYEPISGLKNADEIFEKLKDSGPQAFRDLLRFGISEPLEEIEIRKDIASKAKITNAVSKKVRDQYEENPYPRWKYIHANQRTHDASIDILIAGCGTGQQSALAATLYPNAKIRNIDLSLASLAYAIRQAKALGLKNVSFEHADILGFDSGGGKFDMIECVGVLHHMEKPAEGLKALKKLLKPEGRMALGLYSAAARSDITEIRKFLIKEKYGTGPDDIRRARQDITNHPDPVIAHCAYKSEFFSMSSCRDLVLHAQEHVFTIPKIQAMLEETGLTFMGFSFNTKNVFQAFSKKFPEENALFDLKKWEIFENENQGLFAGMYIFTVCHAES